MTRPRSSGGGSCWRSVVKVTLMKDTPVTARPAGKIAATVAHPGARAWKAGAASAEGQEAAAHGRQAADEGRVPGRGGGRWPGRRSPRRRRCSEWPPKNQPMRAPVADAEALVAEDDEQGLHGDEGEVAQGPGQGGGAQRREPPETGEAAAERGQPGGALRLGPGADLHQHEQGQCGDHEGAGVEAEGDSESLHRSTARKPARGGPSVQASVRTNWRRELTTTRARSVARAGSHDWSPESKVTVRLPTRKAAANTIQTRVVPREAATREGDEARRPAEVGDHQEAAERGAVQEHPHGEAEEQGGQGLEGGGEAQVEGRAGQVDDEQGQREQGDVVAEEGGRLPPEEPAEVAAGGGRLRRRSQRRRRSWAARIPAGAAPEREWAGSAFAGAGACGSLQPAAVRPSARRRRGR